jgi:hypothetical protein
MFSSKGAFDPLAGKERNPMVELFGNSSTSHVG